ncbi:hypothetical protein CYY_003589 [Polysphondylium violaceum]|uniref:Presenilin n=1 Tax=Polysphondylium violaceum TaxID=133409 RepID=A0A8J4PWL0_9MYCE|nr:hypothetical protein CYY_003589 [Polysphondylium violaceum]
MEMLERDIDDGTMPSSSSSPLDSPSTSSTNNASILRSTRQNKHNNDDDIENEESNLREETPLLEVAQESNQDEEDDQVTLQDFSDLIITVLTPVTITIALTVYAVRSFNNQTYIESTTAIGSIYTTFNSGGGGGGDTTFVDALISSLIFLGTLILTTVGFVLLYKYRCTIIIYGWLFLSVGSLLGSLGGYTLINILAINNMSLDWISFVFIVFNLTVGGILAIFWYCPQYLTQMYLILVSVLTAISFTKLPEWTALLLLALVAIYDLFAVLCPRGPLKVLLELAQERNETIPALIYETNKGSDSNLKLGLGDFIFYSVLIGRAALRDMATVFSCYVAVITGLFMTLLLLALFKKALPALPISIGFGIAFYFLSNIFLLPFVEKHSMVMAFV